jgi:hypothetical protein
MGCFALIGVMAGFGIMLWAFSISTTAGFIITSVVTILVFWLYSYIQTGESKKKSIETNEKVNKLFELEKSLENFKVSQKFTTPNIDKMILLDEENKQVAFIESQFSSKEIYNYDDILESEILEDGKTITTTSRGSQVVGALIGGALIGGVGAIIGGLSGKKTSDEEIYRIDLKVIVNNTKSPIKLINFMNSDSDLSTTPVPTKKEEPKYKSAKRNIDHWYSLLSVLIKIDDKKEEVKIIDKIETKPILSNADELRKLSDLYKDGILTEEEFTQQKQKLLSS